MLGMMSAIFSDLVATASLKSVIDPCSSSRFWLIESKFSPCQFFSHWVVLADKDNQITVPIDAITMLTMKIVESKSLNGFMNPNISFNFVEPIIRLPQFLSLDAFVVRVLCLLFQKCWHSR